MLDLLEAKRFHLVGIKGVAMTALARILQDLGKEVTGSDLPAQFQTQHSLRDAGIKVYEGFSPEQVKSAEVVVYSAAHLGSANPEVVAAQSLHKHVLSFPELVGMLTTLKETVAVCGCHGKTTTSSLISYLAVRAGLNSSFFVGVSEFMNLPGGCWNEGRLLVVEADEYLTDPVADRRSKFLHFNPQQIVATNIDFDHPDFFNNLEEVKAAFKQFFAKLPAKGWLIVNGEDEELVKLAASSGKAYFSYGFSSKVDYQIRSKNEELTFFFRSQPLLVFKPKLIGQHNQLNLAAALSYFHRLGYDLDQFKPAVEEFEGAKRRLELLGHSGANLIIDDYGHHPTEIASSIDALKQKYPNHQIALCFQPHTYSRTKSLYPQFLEVFKKPDYLGLLPIFASARETVDPNYSSQQMLSELSQPTSSQLLNSLPDWESMIKRTRSRHQPWIYLLMGAGDVYQQFPQIKKLLDDNL